MEKINFKVVGRWFDVLTYEDGTVENGQHGDFEWGYNQIQNTCAVLLASLLKGEATHSPINFLAIGSGNIAWDTVPPTKSYDQTTLTTEFFRKAVNLTDMTYLDPDTDLVSVTPTRKIEIGVTLLPGEATGSLREFALFGGTATAAVDSGEMVNWITHALIDKDIALQIFRRIRIEFQIQ